jgi:hypothetical protein
MSHFLASLVAYFLDGDVDRASLKEALRDFTRSPACPDELQATLRR